MNNPDAGELIAAYQYHGVQIPKGLLPPELDDIEHDYWQAFCDLTGDRQDGGSIQWTSIRRYWEVEGFGDFATFRQIISAMDNVILAHRRRQQKER